MTIVTSKSIQAVNFDDFVDMLYDAGWQPTLDAQYTQIRELYDNLTILKSSDYRADLS